MKLAHEVIQDYMNEYGPHDKDSGAQYVLNQLSQAIADLEKQERLREPTEEMILTLRGNSMLGHEDARDALRDILEETPLYTVQSMNQRNG